MNFKKIVIYFLLTFIVSELLAQNKNSYEKPGICIQYLNTKEIKIIHINSKIKYWLYDSDKAKKGRIIGIKDSSVIIKDKEIKLEDIRKFGIRRGTTGPLIIAGLVTVIVGLTPIFIVSTVMSNRSYDMTKKWHFIKSINPIVDSSKLEQYKKSIEKDSILQNASSPLSFTLNPLNCIFNQCTLEMEYRLRNFFSIGIGGGLVYKNSWYHSVYNGTDDNYPTCVYKGWLMMLNLKRLNINKSHWYFETSIFYKYLYYDHVLFDDTYPEPTPETKWIRSEIADVYGIKFLMGKRIYMANHIVLEPILGISLRERRRSFITYWSNDNDNPWGICNKNQIFPGLQAGLLLTFGNFKKK